MPKESLKDNLEGNQLDLSLNQLEVVPVKEMAALPKATKIDLSCNLLTSIPPELCSLTQIVELDLSKNKIQSLPDNFGALQKLQRLDLYQNQIQKIPVSFGYLKNLRWLDLKNNPLDETLQSVAGECLTDVQCKNCAKNMVGFMKKVQSEEERRRQKRLQDEREKDIERKAEEAKEREKKKAEKKTDKERKRREYEAAKAREEQSTKETEEAEPADEAQPTKLVEKKSMELKEKAGFSCCGVFLTFVIGLLAVVVGLYFYCESNPSDGSCKQGKQVVTQYISVVKQSVQQYMK